MADASLYQIQLATPNFEHAAQILIDSITEKNSYSKILTPNTYEWRVRALNSAYATAYTTNGFIVLKNTDFEQSSVTLVEPKDNFYTNNKTLNFSWEVVVDALEYRFRLQKENQTTFDTILKSNSLEKVLEDGNYSWEVRGQIATINTLFSKRDFIVDTEAPNKATLTNPANNAQEEPASIRFQWERESKTGSPEFDVIYIYTDSNLTNLL
ncbi:MAG: hypothetical protein OIF50_10975, partial [Flavobacteriaceae bacterium]|nr:hypothetical protein [Flavobacteriaceae bacterium]